MAAKARKKNRSTRPDFATLGGLALAVTGIVGGLILEGGEISDITQATAAMIVLGGTIGAVLISTPVGVLGRSLRRAAHVWTERSLNLPAIIDEIIEFATKARKDGIVSLENDTEQASDPFLAKALNLAVDGTDIQEIRAMMELQIHIEEQHVEAEAKVFEAAGGYAPTIGIIGAVMGLIQVMKNLSDIDKVGHGIAVAFVATVYGVGVANIVFLPMANKIKARAHQAAQARELMLEGVVGIVEGLNPKLIRSKLEAFVEHHAPAKQGSKKALKGAGRRETEAA
jgi:chemotaxis protein MotA